MRTDLIIATDEDYEDQLITEEDVACVPGFGDIIQIGADDYKVIERRFQYRPDLKNIRLCICWIRVELIKE